MREERRMLNVPKDQLRRFELSRAKRATRNNKLGQLKHLQNNEDPITADHLEISLIESQEYSHDALLERRVRMM